MLGATSCRAGSKGSATFEHVGRVTRVTTIHSRIQDTQNVKKKVKTNYLIKDEYLNRFKTSLLIRKIHTTKDHKLVPPKVEAWSSNIDFDN